MDRDDYAFTTLATFARFEGFVAEDDPQDTEDLAAYDFALGE